MKSGEIGQERQNPREYLSSQAKKETCVSRIEASSERLTENTPVSQNTKKGWILMKVREAALSNGSNLKVLFSSLFPYITLY